MSENKTLASSPDKAPAPAVQTVLQPEHPETKPAPVPFYRLQPGMLDSSANGQTTPRAQAAHQLQQTVGNTRTGQLMASTEGEPVDEAKIATLLRHLAEGRWDVDSLAAKLNDTEMRSLPSAARVDLVRSIGDGLRVGNEDEKTLVRLLGTTPPAQASALLKQLRADGSALLEILEGAIHFDEYRQYHQVLRTVFLAGLGPSQVLEQADQAAVFPWADPGLIQAMWKVRFYYETVELTDAGKLRVKYWINRGPMGLETQPQEIDPFDLIKVRFYHPEAQVGAEEGQIVLMPAVNLLGLYAKQFKNELSTSVDVALLFAGGLGLVSAGTKTQKAVAALDLLFGASDLTIREFRADIAQLEGGKEFLETWDVVSTLVTVYGIGRVLMEAPAAFRKLKDVYKRFKSKSADVLEPNVAARLDNEMAEMAEVAEGAERELKATPQGPSPELGHPPEITKSIDPNSVSTADAPQRNRWLNRPSVTPDASLPAGEGVTDKFGNIRYSTRGSQADQDLTLYHEKVHSFLSPKLEPLRDFRADLMMAGYEKSSLLRYLEEAMAESYAQLRVNGIKGLPDGLRFPVANGYVELRQVASEAAFGTISVAGTVYTVYVFTSPEKTEQRSP